MTKRILNLIFAIGLMSVVVTCSKDDDDNGNGNGNGNGCETENLTYEGEIKAIIETNCAISGCHAAGSPYPEFTTYEAVRDIALDGSMEDRITREQSDPLRMPQVGSLDECTIEQLIAWANDGAPEE